MQQIDRSRASGYLNELARMGFLRQYKKGREIRFFPAMKVPKRIVEKTERSQVLPETITASFNNARYWLKTIQNVDGGWGECEGDVSSMTNTAESILALSQMNENPESIVMQKGTSYILGGLSKFSSGELAARECALVGWALFKVYGAEAAIELKEMQKVVKCLQNNQDREGSWDRRSVYSTAIVMRFLSNFHSQPYSSMVNTPRDWLLQVFNGKGWGRKPDSETDLAVTAQVLFSLNKIGCKDFKMELGHIFLLEEVENWSRASEDLVIRATRRSLWRHFPLPCIICALLSFPDGEPSEAIVDGLVELLELQHESGGWCTAKGEMPKTWATLNAVMALDLCLEKLASKKTTET